MTASAYITEKYIILKLNYNIHLTITVWKSAILFMVFFFSFFF